MRTFTVYASLEYFRKVVNMTLTYFQFRCLESVWWCLEPVSRKGIFPEIQSLHWVWWLWAKVGEWSEIDCQSIFSKMETFSDRWRELFPLRCDEFTDSIIQRITEELLEDMQEVEIWIRFQPSCWKGYTLSCSNR